jgi:hypothetical protein
MSCKITHKCLCWSAVHHYGKILKKTTPKGKGLFCREEKMREREREKGGRGKEGRKEGRKKGRKMTQGQDISVQGIPLSDLVPSTRPHLLVSTIFIKL